VRVIPGNPKKNDLASKLKEILEMELSSSSNLDLSSKVDDEAEDLISKTLEELSEEPVSESNITIKPVVVRTQSPTKEATFNQKIVTKADGGASPSKIAIDASKADPLAARAARFGVTAAPVTVPGTPKLDALKKRSARFGENVSTELKKLETEQKLVERSKRFQDDKDSVKTAPEVTDEKIAARQARFGVVAKEPAKTNAKGAKPATKVAPAQNKRKDVAILSPEEEEKIKKRRERFGLA